MDKNWRCFAERHKQINGVTRVMCEALTQVRCSGYDDCPFYRSRDEYMESRGKANARLRDLPHDRQKNIAEMYYQKTMPWKE